MRRGTLLAVALACTGPAAAAPLTVSKASVVVADGVDLANPKAIPGAAVDYTILVANPGANTLATVGRVTVTDPLPAGVKLRVADLGAAGSGPVEFVDGNLLGLGLLGSGLSFVFASLGSSADGVDFSADGVSWGYVPVPDASGCDPAVRAIRVRLSGNQVAGSGFRLRFRVVVK
jgi:uncharacterized repeat protein (TIGR01451 family)